ncbi:MAG: AmmeMemoRadiSam system radical SAM enzyme [Bacteroidetes bacterium]|nr:AmmeMemoRadiSam system radical SAM enzyme [Bacteroidota bacterium]
MVKTAKTNTYANKITKRDFLKSSIFGVGSVVAGAFFFPLIPTGAKAKTMNLKDDIPDLLKHSKEALYYSVKDNNYVKCNLCPNACYLSENSRSICKNKFNYKGKLYTIAYGNPCVVNTDPIEKKPLFHFFPATDIYSIATAGCNLHCLNCQNWTISQVGTETTTNYNFTPSDIVDFCVNSKIPSIAYTYSEPIAFYEYMLETAKIARKKGVKNVLISNGYINDAPLDELSKYLDAASINLKSFKDSIYKDLNGGSLQPVLNTLKTLSEKKVWLEIINLIVPTWTDNMDMVKEMCKWLADNGFTETPLHFSRFTPMYKLTNLPYTPVSVLEEAKAAAMQAGLKYVYIGNVPGHDAENTYCSKCSKKIINRKGFKVIENHIINGSCEYCGTAIAGIWE